MARIGINARYIQSRPTGIAKYILNSILNLKAAHGGDEYMLFFGSDKPVPEIIRNTGFDCDIPKVPTNNQLSKFLWAQLYIPHAVKKHRIDLFHEFSIILPFIKKCRTVLTVYDLAHLYVPECYTRMTRLYLDNLLPGSIRRADSIVALSECTKCDIVKHFGVDPAKIKVVYAGVDETFRPVDDQERLKEVKNFYGIKRDFILAVSLISPRKNLTRLIKAFKALRDRGKADLQLVIVGRKAWLYEDIFREVASSGLEKDVIFCGHVPTEHLLCLYNAASVFAYPSLYEGFGLPILEAMTCGTPVVSSNVSSMPEACGEAALLADPYNIEDLTSALDDAISKPSLRQNLIEKGLEHAKRFSWKKTGAQTLAVYNELI